MKTNQTESNTSNSAVKTSDVVLVKPMGMDRDVTAAGGNDESLTCLRMWWDGIQASKRACDPVSDVFGTMLGCVCCMATALAQDEHDRETPATRHDIVHANRIRRQERETQNCAYELGYCLGDIVIDTTAVTGGVVVGGVRAIGLSIFGNNKSSDLVMCQDPQAVRDTDIFDSCTLGNLCS